MTDQMEFTDGVLWIDGADLQVGDRVVCTEEGEPTRPPVPRYHQPKLCEVVAVEPYREDGAYTVVRLRLAPSRIVDYRPCDDTVVCTHNEERTTVVLNAIGVWIESDRLCPDPPSYATVCAITYRRVRSDEQLGLEHLTTLYLGWWVRVEDCDPLDLPDWQYLHGGGRIIAHTHHNGPLPTVELQVPEDRRYRPRHVAHRRPLLPPA